MTPSEITGPLKVVGTEYPRMHVIENDVNAVPGDFKSKYVRFDGYFGPHGPHVFAAAPQMLEALITIRDRLGQCAETPASAADAYDSFYRDVINEAIKAASAGDV